MNEGKREEAGQWEQVGRTVRTALESGLKRLVLSGVPKDADVSRVRLRPVLLKGKVMFQAEEQAGPKALHRNLSLEEAVSYVTEGLKGGFKQAQMETEAGDAVILVSKKGKATVRSRLCPAGKKQPPVMLPMSHNRQKRYILEEGRPVPFLVDLGVMTEDGRVVKSRYDKFRQINRFLEMVADVAGELPGDREITIIDFGCGKSYLTFAIYYYLRVLKGRQVRIIGLDLKEDVIRQCSRLSEAYGYEGLTFEQGDIAGFEGVSQVDMVVTLHACDKATDYALAKAVAWGAKVILSVPCCQHELNGQIECGLLEPVLQYGLIRERMAALYTDAIRAQVLEHVGYRTQLLEFIDMEHTPKNILIRAVRQGGKRDNGAELCRLMEFLGVRPAIGELLAPEILPEER